MGFNFETCLVIVFIVLNIRIAQEKNRLKNADKTGK